MLPQMMPMPWIFIFFVVFFTFFLYGSFLHLFFFSSFSFSRVSLFFKYYVLTW